MEPRVIAFYLPQFHQIPENDMWWGKGFTEWVNVSRAEPLFADHHHPRIPTELGYYDLSEGAIHQQQSDLAREHRVDGFCMYFYWFEGHQLLETPINIWRNNSSLLPYCLCWANEPWSRRWDGRNHDVLMPQSYPTDYEKELFADLLPHFTAPHYMHQASRPILLVHRADLIPNPRQFSARLRRLSREADLPGLYLVASETTSDIDPRALGFDAIAEFPPVGSNTLRNALLPLPLGLDPEFRGRILSYPRIINQFLRRKVPPFPRHRGVMPQWDNTARRGLKATIYDGATPGLYRQWLANALTDEAERRGGDGLVFINAWNEWAESAYLEPDATNGHAYLEATKLARDTAPMTFSSDKLTTYAHNLGMLAASSIIGAQRKAHYRIGPHLR